MAQPISENEQRFEAVLQDWKALVAEADRMPEHNEVLKSDDEVLQRWGVIFGVLRREQIAMVENGDWFSGRTDLLSVIGRARREVDHCAVLAWLLDPKSPNGLGVMFLRRFLVTCFPSDTIDPRGIVSARLRCEECRDNSRADLIIRTDRMTVVVEAKVDHIERLEQCDDLFRDYQHEPGASFIFLTPDGRAPETATGEAKERFRTLSFPNVAQALRGAIEEAGNQLCSHPAHATIACYLQTLEGEFS